MNSSRQDHPSAADDQAALWAARLDGDSLDRAQRAELDAWLADAPEHRALLSQYCQFSADLEEQVPALVAAGAISMPATTTENEAAERPRRRFTRLAFLSLATAATLAVTLFALRPSPQIQNVAMASAQRGAERLADGTRVELNANTSLRFENSTSERRARLAGGEAYFVVAKDPARPFIVETPAGSVRVTGTTFNVRSDSVRHAFEVTVVEGSVNVRPAESGAASDSAPIPLKAGDQFSSAAGGQRALSPSELEDALAWRQGTVVFNDVPLSEAVARFAQYHGCAIHVSPAIAGERVGGRFSIDDLRGFLAGLELALPRVKYHDEPSGAVVLSLRPGS